MDLLRLPWLMRLLGFGSARTTGCCPHVALDDRAGGGRCFMAPLSLALASLTPRLIKDEVRASSFVVACCLPLHLRLLQWCALMFETPNPIGRRTCFAADPSAPLDNLFITVNSLSGSRHRPSTGPPLTTKTRRKVEFGHYLAPLL